MRPNSPATPCFYSGGEGGIRTHGTRKGSTVFETARFNHSRTSPAVLNYFYYTLSRTSSALHRRQNRDGLYWRGRRLLCPPIQPRIDHLRLQLLELRRPGYYALGLDFRIGDLLRERYILLQVVPDAVLDQPH